MTILIIMSQNKITTTTTPKKPNSRGENQNPNKFQTPPPFTNKTRIPFKKDQINFLRNKS
jgi:hypothetical protein